MFNFGFQEQFVTLIENSFKNYSSLKNTSDFMKLFRDHDEVNQLSLEKENEDLLTLLEWKLVHKRFRILFIESQILNSILFLIPYKSYSNWVEAEFNTQKGEFSGERGRLNPFVNPNAQLKYIADSSIGHPVVLLTGTGSNMTKSSMEDLLEKYFKNAEL